jgi:hypothetical protein
VQVPLPVSQLESVQQSESELQGSPVQPPLDPDTHEPVLVSHVSPPAQSASLVQPPLELGSPGTQTPLPSQMSPGWQSESLAHSSPPCTHSPTLVSHASPAGQSASDAHMSPAISTRQYPVSQTEPAAQSVSTEHAVAVTVPVPALPTWPLTWQEQQSAMTSPGKTNDRSFMTFLRAHNARTLRADWGIFARVPRKRKRLA